jgi:aryl-alcohol dehydrogenase
MESQLAHFGADTAGRLQDRVTIVTGASRGSGRAAGELLPKRVHFALDTTSVPSVTLAAIDSTGGRGSIGLVGIDAGEFSISGPRLVGRTLTFFLEGNAGPQQLFLVLVDPWRRGRFPLDRMIRTYPLAGVNAAERDTHLGTVIKPVLLPWAS